MGLGCWARILSVPSISRLDRQMTEMPKIDMQMIFEVSSFKEKFRESDFYDLYKRGRNEHKPFYYKFVKRRNKR